MSAQQINLNSHPAHPGKSVDGLSVLIQREAGGLSLVYNLRGAPETLIIPAPMDGQRRDELWTHTCFELFLKNGASKAYREFNFSPSGDWAAYRFEDYRQGRADLDCPAPQIATRINDHGVSVSVTLQVSENDLQTGQVWLGPSAIVEAKDGTRSYWALHHPEDNPDFHHTQNFKISLD